MNWWQRLWKRRQLEDRLGAELRDHFDRLVADDIARGVPSSDAARNARLEFGGIEGIKEECRDARGTRWVHDCAQDLRYALRALARDPWFTAVTVVSLALGIGVCSMAFTITDAYFFRGLPVDHPERMLHAGTTDGQGRSGGVSFPDYLDWRASLTGVELAAFTTGQMIVKEDGRAPDRLYGAYVSADVFRLLGANAAIGRVFTRDDELPGRTSVVLIGHRLWTDRYDADRSLPGRTILVNGTPATVLGVMPEGFGFPFQQQFWLPLDARPGSKQDRADRSLDVLARIVDGQNAGAVASAWRTVTTRLATDYPDTNADVDVTLVPFAEHQVGRITNSPALLLPVTAAIVLLIACTNVANLLLARASTRTRELAIRTSVGATRWRTIRQLLTESLLLAGLGGLAGLGTAIFAVNALAGLFEGNIPYWMTFTTESRSLLAVGVFSIIATLLFGLAPALGASRTGTSAAMSPGVRSGISPRSSRWSSGLVAVQFALSVVLLGATGLLVRSYAALLDADSSIDASRFTTMRIELPEAEYPSGDRRAEFYRQLEATLGATPGVEAAGLASVLPFLGAPGRIVTFRGEGTADDTTVRARAVAISPTYFETLGLALLRGRAFEDSDGLQGRKVAIINQLLAERYFPGQDPIGREIHVGTTDTRTPGAEGRADRVDDAPWAMVVGIAPTVGQAVASGPGPVVYLPQRSDPALSTMVILRAPTFAASTVAAVRAQVASIDDDVLVSTIGSLEGALRNSRLQPRLIATVLGALGIVALVLSAVGLYAITSHGVRQRTPEVGLRLALGARPSQVVWMLMQRAMRPAAAGLVIGLLGAYAVGRLIQGLLIDTRATDPATLSALLLLLTSVTGAACFIPARRSARVDPASLLRRD